MRTLGWSCGANGRKPGRDGDLDSEGSNGISTNMTLVALHDAAVAVRYAEQTLSVVQLPELDFHRCNTIMIRLEDALKLLGVETVHELVDSGELRARAKVFLAVMAALGYQICMLDAGQWLHLPEELEARQFALLRSVHGGLRTAREEIYEILRPTPTSKTPEQVAARRQARRERKRHLKKGPVVPAPCTIMPAAPPAPEILEAASEKEATPLAVHLARARLNGLAPKNTGAFLEMEWREKVDYTANTFSLLGLDRDQLGTDIILALTLMPYSPSAWKDGPDGQLHPLPVIVDGLAKVRLSGRAASPLMAVETESVAYLQTLARIVYEGQCRPGAARSAAFAAHDAAQIWAQTVVSYHDQMPSNPTKSYALEAAGINLCQEAWPAVRLSAAGRRKLAAHDRDRTLELARHIQTSLAMPLIAGAQDSQNVHPVIDSLLNYFAHAVYPAAFCSLLLALEDVGENVEQALKHLETAIAMPLPPRDHAMLQDCLHTRHSSLVLLTELCHRLGREIEALGAAIRAAATAEQLHKIQPSEATAATLQEAKEMQTRMARAVKVEREGRMA